MMLVPLVSGAPITGRRQKAIWVGVLILLASCCSLASATVDSHRLVVRDFKDVEPPIRTWADKAGAHIEVCGGDWCQLVTRPSKRRLQDRGAWDAAYLMIYFFGSSDDYRARRKESARQLLDGYAAACPGRTQNLDTVRCVLRHLSTSQALRYFHVTYDEGARCVGRFHIDPPHFAQSLICASAPVRELDPADWARKHRQNTSSPVAPR